MIEGLVLGFAGGLLIGAGAGLFLLVNGRILGISGLASALVGRWPANWQENVLLLGGIMAGAWCFAAASGHVVLTLPSLPRLIAGGVLVGVGSAMANGCTSGHAVCGIARLSPRSLAATGIFMAVAVLTVLAAGGL